MIVRATPKKTARRKPYIEIIEDIAPEIEKIMQLRDLLKTVYIPQIRVILSDVEFPRRREYLEYKRDEIAPLCRNFLQDCRAIDIDIITLYNGGLVLEEGIRACYSDNVLNKLSEMFGTTGISLAIIKTLWIVIATEIMNVPTKKDTNQLFFAAFEEMIQSSSIASQVINQTTIYGGEAFFRQLLPNEFSSIKDWISRSRRMLITRRPLYLLSDRVSFYSGHQAFEIVEIGGTNVCSMWVESFINYSRVPEIIYVGPGAEEFIPNNLPPGIEVVYLDQESPLITNKNFPGDPVPIKKVYINGISRLF